MVLRRKLVQSKMKELETTFQKSRLIQDQVFPKRGVSHIFRFYIIKNVGHPFDAPF
jgi:hypothetical protein